MSDKCIGGRRDILQHRFAHGSNWISSVEYHVEDNIGRVDDTAKPAIDTP